MPTQIQADGKMHWPCFLEKLRVEISRDGTKIGQVVLGPSTFVQNFVHTNIRTEDAGRLSLHLRLKFEPMEHMHKKLQ